MSIRVQLQQFEGPLDLLLYLIRKEEMDIFNINIVDITRQYFEYIKLMKEFDIEIAGDFIAMAATLIHIKSKMLLPQYDENGEVVETEDPRKELVQKLLEYEKYKEAARSLYERPLLNRDQWARGVREKIEVKDDEIELEENALFSLIGSYRKAMRTLQKKVHKVNVKLQSIASRILEMSAILTPGRTVRMVEMFNHSLTDRLEKSRNALITFLSLLELGKLGFVSLYQTDVYGDIHVTAKKEIEGDVVSRVEEYGQINAEEKALTLFEKAQKEMAEIDFDSDEADSAPSADQQMALEDFAQFDQSVAQGSNPAAAEDVLTFDAATDEEIMAELESIEKEESLAFEPSLDQNKNIDVANTDESSTDLQELTPKDQQTDGELV